MNTLTDRPPSGRPELAIRTFWIAASLVAAASLAIILFSSPLFATLGFEYSALSALVLSVVCGVRAALHTSCLPKGKLMVDLLREQRLDLLLTAIPFILSSLSTLWLSNCSFGDGIIFYLEVALPSAILASAFGWAAGRFFLTARGALLGYLAFWLITLILSLLPGYSNPQLFTFGWQYGFFPGFVWDEALELGKPYAIFRFENLLWVLFVVVSVYEIERDHEVSRRAVGPGLLFLLILLFFGSHDDLGITSTHEAVREELRSTLAVGHEGWVHYAPNSFTSEELDRLTRDVDWYFHDIERRFDLQPNSDPIHIYVYPDVESLFHFIGTRSASIAKPWLGELHITKDNLPSLKHELTHVLLRVKGSFPFYASWSTGLTEGAAMSVEPRYDGLLTLDEHAARILQLGYAKGVTSVMAFTGFASNASQKSYVLAGSFSRYLLRNYGPAKFDRVYSSLSFEKEYGKSLEALDAEWKQSLQPYQTVLNAVDSARFRYFYDRSSIIFVPCLRRIGKLQRRALEAFEEHRYDISAQKYTEALQEGAGLSAVVGLSDALVQQNKVEQALRVIDTVKMTDVVKQKPVLASRQGDLHSMLGDTSLAEDLYAFSERLRLSASSFLTAYSHGVMVRSSVSQEYRAYLLAAYREDTLSQLRADSLLHYMQRSYTASRSDTTGTDRLRTLLDYFVAVTNERRGRLSTAARFPDLSSLAELPTEEDSLAFYLMATRIRALRGGNGREDLCPIKYLAAAKEYANELRAKEEYLASPARRPGRERRR